jgi:hypothetical protein
MEDRRQPRLATRLTKSTETEGTGKKTRGPVPPAPLRESLPSPLSFVLFASFALVVLPFPLAPL